MATMGWHLKLCLVILLVATVIGKDNGQNRARLHEEQIGDPPPDSDPDTGEEQDTTRDTIVNITQGSVRGFITNNKILSYIDIPYGKFNMFQTPNEADGWSDVHYRTKHEKRCPQLDENNLVGDKDCLVLSIFKPIEVEADASVVFHIHDGNFVNGSGDFNIYGPEYLVEKGIIVVLPNYRLGVLGFLCLQNETAPGNAALKDLTLALKWVKVNIAAFGGHPDKITVSAEGQAGALVGLLALSSESNQLFKQAITESGAILAPWALDRDPKAKGLKLIELLTENSKEDNDDSVLITTDLEVMLLKARKGNLIFKPCVERGDGAFIKDTPWKIINEEGFRTNLTFMIGSANKAGIHETERHTNESIAELNDNIELLIPDDLLFRNNDAAKRAAADAIKKLYFDGEKISNKTKEELALFYTDSAYLGPSLRLARYLLKGGAVIYMYEFACDGPRNIEKLAIDSNIPGAARGDIIGYVFKQDEASTEEEEKPEKESNEAEDSGEVKQELQENDEQVVKLLLDFWASFIMKGEPSSQTETWKSMNASREKLMIISAEPVLEEAVHPKRMVIWTELYNRHFIERNNSNSTKTISIFTLFTILLYRVVELIVY